MYYGFRKDFDYRAYLEQKSHFDRIEFAVDSGIKQLICSDEALAASGIEAIRSLDQSINDGFETLAIPLKSIQSSVEDLTHICDQAFAEIQLSLGNIESSINKLVDIAQTPDQTWALEQYSIAANAFRKNLIEEAFDYINRAISGYGHQPGFRLDPRFYKLRGIMYMGNYHNHSSRFVNLPLAINDFLLAAKYTGSDNSNACGGAYSLAGWAAYCNGNIDDAERYYQLALSHDAKDARSRFELAKVLFHASKTEQARAQFDDALRRDWKYGLRAGADPDFLKHRQIVADQIYLYAKEIREKIDNSLKNFDVLFIDKKKDVIQRNGLSLDSEAKINCEDAKIKIRYVSIAELKQFEKNVPLWLERLKTNFCAANHALQRQLDLLYQEPPKRVSVNDEVRRVVEFLLFWLPGGVVLSLAIYDYQYEHVGDFFSLVIASLIVGWLGSIVLTPLITELFVYREWKQRRKQHICNIEKIERDMRILNQPEI